MSEWKWADVMGVSAQHEKLALVFGANGDEEYVVIKGREELKSLLTFLLSSWGEPICFRVNDEGAGEFRVGMPDESE